MPNLITPGQAQSRVYRVDPRADYPTAPTLWATGLTTVNGCTFDSQGNFWASELLHTNPAAPPGDLVKIPFGDPTNITHITDPAIVLPAGITQGPDGAMYVATFAATEGHEDGKIVRLTFG